MAEVGTCTWSPGGHTATVEVNGRQVSLTAKGPYFGVTGSKRTVDLANPTSVSVTDSAFWGMSSSDRVEPITRGERWRTVYNRCANSLSRQNNPLWRPVRDVANLF